ncbi:transcriptional regulator, TetR family [Segniliparus rotundus DSM 44985]|uniref:Transcriptional regulator, TetR family n=1 Tax=Segniliparus rotundus (strain ATCC BAA-972 / CDC 1076 / CIP 108378 / DSM 44985 / JCM 13578) TaxID=640132 RepID=D6ZBM3_SEGRD|nr:TetR/AcrR family transcriptional regulator [Segniliparus rotundus]ADG98975.1 transcriptional regulator, TetR family [Segniliparus rotundus DSM 44985]
MSSLMPNTAPRTATRPPGRKTQLLRIGSELFAAKGYPNVSVAQIAAAAGVTAPAIYRHFPDKQAILGEAVLDAIHRLEEVTTPELTFDEFVIEMTSVTVARPDLAVLWRWGVMHLDAQWRGPIRERSRALLGRWTTGIRMLRPELDPEQARMMARVMASTVSSAIVRPGRLSSAKHASMLTDVVRRVMATQLPPAAPAPSQSDEIPEEARQDHSAAARGKAGANAGARGRREQLLGAASELFLARGYAAVGVDELGAAVGISGPSVYRHFPDKQAVLAAVCLRGVRRLSEQVETELGQLEGNDPGSRLRALVRAHTSVLLSSSDLVVAASIGSVELAGPAGQEARDFLRAHITRWSTALLQLDEDLSPAEAKVVVYAALTLANDLARGRSTRNRPHLEAEMSALMAAAVGLGPG